MMSMALTCSLNFSVSPNKSNWSKAEPLRKGSPPYMDMAWAGSFTEQGLRPTLGKEWIERT